MASPNTMNLSFDGGKVDLIGVPFDGMGRVGGQARAPEELRAAGLPAALGATPPAQPDVLVPAPNPTRAVESGLLNEPALLEMVTALHARVDSSLRAGRFPFIYGADCSVLLAALPALNEVAGKAGLVFLDGHEDATPVESSPDGEAANMEIALLAGFTGGHLPEPLCSWLPVLGPHAIAMLGPRDENHRHRLDVATVGDRVWLRPPEEIRIDPAAAADAAVRHVTAEVSHWWLHIDFDVLAATEFSACGAPDETPLPGGLTWPELTTVVATALRGKGCRGWSMTVYNPDLDPDGAAARDIVQFVSNVAGS